MRNARVIDITDFYKTNRPYFQRMAAGHSYAYYDSVLRLLRKARIDLKNKKVVDIGCGSGSLTKILKNKYKKINAFGTDISSLGNPSRFLIFKKANAEHTSFKDKEFDVAFLVDVLEHTLNPRKVLEESKRILKKGGYLVIRLPNYSSPFINGFSINVIIREMCSYFNKPKYPKKIGIRLIPNLTGDVGGDQDAVTGIEYRELLGELTRNRFSIVSSETWGGGPANSSLIRLLNYLPIIKFFGTSTTIISRLVE